MKNVKKLLPLIFCMIFSVSLLMPLAGIHAAANPDLGMPSGDYFVYTVDVDTKNPPQTYCISILKPTDYVIGEGDMLEYDVKFEPEMNGLGAVDANIQGVPVPYRDIPNLKDQNDVGVHPGNDLSLYAYEDWYHRVMPLGVTVDTTGDEKYATVGKKLTAILVDTHPVSDETQYTTVSYYDNIVVTNNGEVKYVIYKDNKDVDPAGIKPLPGNTKDSKGTFEFKTFSAAEEQEIYDLRAQKEAEAEQKKAEAAAKKAEAESRAAAEEESKRIAESESAAAASAEAATQQTTAESSAASGSSDSNSALIIGSVAAAVVIAGIVIFIIVKNKGKK